MNQHKVPKYQAFVLNSTLWRDEGPARGTLCRYENVPIHTNTRQKRRNFCICCKSTFIERLQVHNFIVHDYFNETLIWSPSGMKRKFKTGVFTINNSMQGRRGNNKNVLRWPNALKCSCNLTKYKSSESLCNSDITFW